MLSNDSRDRVTEKAYIHQNIRISPSSMHLDKAYDSHRCDTVHSDYTYIAVIACIKNVMWRKL